MTQETLKLALEALENSVDLVVEDAYNAEQLYNNYPTRQGKVGGLKILADQHKAAITAIKEALAQPEQEPVAQLKELEATEKQVEILTDELAKCQRMVETLSQPKEPEQEPVAYLCENAVGHKYFRWKKPSSTYKPIALYTTPPQRTWVGLTEEEVANFASRLWPLAEKQVSDRLRAIEAKLKEKNT